MWNTTCLSWADITENGIGFNWCGCLLQRSCRFTSRELDFQLWLAEMAHYLVVARLWWSPLNILWSSWTWNLGIHRNNICTMNWRHVPHWPQRSTSWRVKLHFTRHESLLLASSQPLLLTHVLHFSCPLMLQSDGITSRLYAAARASNALLRHSRLFLCLHMTPNTPPDLASASRAPHPLNNSSWSTSYRLLYMPDRRCSKSSLFRVRLAIDLLR